jgi:O-antigen/teichoic acid export membrane protein
VPILFTPAWNAAIVPIQILGAASMVVASAGTPGEVLRGIGRPDVDFRLNLAIAVFVALPALWFGIHWLGLPGAALAVLAYNCVSRIAYGATLRRMIHLPTRELLRAIQQAVIGCACMVAAKLLLGPSHWIAGIMLAVAAYAIVILPLILPLLRGMVGTSSRPAVPPLTRGSAVPF